MGTTHGEGKGSSGGAVTVEPDACWFGRERPRCFGMLNRPIDGAARGVVICNGLGYEGLLAARPLRELSSRLVALGFAVLRFDYEGAGDSDGGDWEPGRSEEWLASVDEAVGLVRAHGDVEEVYLVGMRWGATVACLYAQSRPGIAGLVLWAPCVVGSGYLRELQALSRLSTAARPSHGLSAQWFPQDSFEVAGFEISRATADDLRRTDLVQSMRRSPAPAVLVVDHRDRPVGDELVEKLREFDTEVVHALVGDYADFMVDDETKSTFPREALDQMTDWFARSRPRLERVDAPAPKVSPTLVVASPTAGHSVPPGTVGPPVVERAVRTPEGLFAIVSEPVEPSLRRRVGLVILNTGLTNRVGQGRLSTEQARYWASLGFTVVRIDLSGSGDSPTLRSCTAQPCLAPERISEAIRTVDWLRRVGEVRQVALFGLCSGAYQSFHAALQGADVDAAMLVNPGVWYNDNHREAGMDIKVAHNSIGAVFRLDEWRRLVRYPRATSVSIRTATTGFAYLLRIWVEPRLRRLGIRVGEPVVLPQDLRRIIGRGIRLLVVFAADEAGESYLRSFGGRSLTELERSGRLTTVHIDGGDHVFSARGARQRLTAVVADYLRDTFGSDPSPQEPQTNVGSFRQDAIPAPNAATLPFAGIELRQGKG